MINRDKKGGKNTRLTYRIIFLECQKIFRNPLVLLVFLTFLLINIVVVQNAYGSQDDQKSVQRMHRVLQAKEQGKKNSDVKVYNEYKQAYGKLYDNLDMLKIMKIKENIYCDMPWPRDIAASDFIELRNRVTDLIRWW